MIRKAVQFVALTLTVALVLLVMHLIPAAVFWAVGL